MTVWGVICSFSSIHNQIQYCFMFRWTPLKGLERRFYCKITFQFSSKVCKARYRTQHRLLIKQWIAGTLSVCFNYDISFRAIAMRILFKEHFKLGIVFNATFHCGLMLIGMVILQAWSNEGISQSGEYHHSISDDKFYIIDCFKVKHRKIYLWLGSVTFLQQKRAFFTG